MTHATAPRSARTLTQAHPTMSCIRLVIMFHELFTEPRQGTQCHQQVPFTHSDTLYIF